jgi:hypothetical protein
MKRIIIILIMFGVLVSVCADNPVDRYCGEWSAVKYTPDEDESFLFVNKYFEDMEGYKYQITVDGDTLFLTFGLDLQERFTTDYKRVSQADLNRIIEKRGYSHIKIE